MKTPQLLVEGLGYKLSRATGSRTKPETAVLYWLRSDRGSTIVESLVAAVVIALALNALLMALSTGMVATNFNSERVTAEVAARSQIEYVKSLPYAASYTAAPSLLPDATYQASLTTTLVSTDLQKVEVAISRGGSQLIALEGLKANR